MCTRQVVSDAPLVEAFPVAAPESRLHPMVQVAGWDSVVLGVVRLEHLLVVQLVEGSVE